MESLFFTGLSIADNGRQGEQIYHAITGQQRIDSKIYRIENEDIVALDIC